MSYSIDDLVASLSANHIGQEQIDIANLQAQLHQTLYAQQQQQHWNAAPCNTPTARTPSTTFAWSDPQRRRSSSTASSSSSYSARRSHFDNDHTMYEEDEDLTDEDAVEQLVDSAEPTSHLHTWQHHHHYTTQHHNVPASSPVPLLHPHPQPNHHHSQHTPFYNYSVQQHAQKLSAAPSSFNTTDPFYVAAEAASRQQPAQTNSFFAQAGRPSPHSPFFATLDAQNTRPRYVAAGCFDA